MTQIRRGRGRRAAFTLVEMLVVIAIIAILVALTAAAVMRALVKGPELQTRTEEGNMDAQLSAMKSNYTTLKYLPSHLRLREDNNYNAPPGPNQAAVQADYNQTVGFLQAAFGRHITDRYLDPPMNTKPNLIDWNGDNVICDGKNPPTAGPPGDLVLEGEQVLVFLLGGVPKQDPITGAIVMTGFPPQVNGGASDKRGPFYEFQGGRLRLGKPPFTAIDQVTGARSNLPYPVYIDPWKSGSFAGGQGMPYVFFSSYVTEGLGSYQADCPSLGLVPYQGPTGKAVNASTWQIISAGKDGQFGPGGVFNPSTGVPAASPGADDQANFSPRVLGAAAN